MVVGPKDFDRFKEAWFRGVYDKHFPELYFYLRSFTSDEELIRDIIQDAFVSLLDKNRMESVSNIKGYLFSCVRNSLYDKIKSDKKKDRVRLEMILEADNPMSESYAVTNENLIALTEEAVRILPVTCRSIFEMIKVEGLTYKQAAERLSLSVKTVETQMGIAFRKIREYVFAAVIEK